MNNETNDIKNYSAEDIRRYWNNQMSPAEMHALEKAAMDDPFLADALEGYSKLKEEPTEDIALLQKRLAARSHGAAVIPMKRNYWWRVAALILLIGGLGTLAFLFTQDEARQLAVQNKNEVSTNTGENIVVAPKSADTASQQVPFPQGSLSSRETPPNKPSLNREKEGAIANDGIAEVSSDDTTSAPGVYKNADDVYRKSEVRAPSAASGAPLSKSISDSISGRQFPERETAARSVSPQGNYLNYFSGKVVDPQNRSIPFATVRITNANQVAAADQYGYFQFKSRDSIAEISISSYGYNDRNVVMNSTQQALSITLNPLNEKGKLKEVKVTSSGKKADARIGDAELNGYIMDAEPLIGWDKYNLYLDSNKKIPTNEPRINGDVVVSFKVNQKGELSSFEIEKSMSKAYNNEAIRLIKQGPAWRVIKGKKPKVKVIVKF